MGVLQASLPNSAFSNVRGSLEISHGANLHQGNWQTPQTRFSPHWKRFNIYQYIILRFMCYRSKYFPDTLTSYFREREHTRLNVTWLHATQHKGKAAGVPRTATQGAHRGGSTPTVNMANLNVTWGA